MPSGLDGTEASPYYFLSYAQNHGFTPAEEYRRDRLVKRFQDDLREAVRELARTGTGSLAAGAVESEPPTAGHWSERVARGLARCRVFVALYSNEYFSSEHCGREWSAFATRIDTHRILRGRKPEPFIPVLWQPVPDEALPPCARELPAPHIDLGPGHRRYGMNYLLRHLPEHRGEYENAVLALARRIIQVGEREAPVQAERYPDYQAQQDAFHRPGHEHDRRPRIRIVVAAPYLARLPRGADPDLYGERPTQWKPYFPDFPGEIAATAKRLAEAMDFQAFVEILEHSQEVRSGAMPSAPTLLIVDAWAAQDPALQQRLSRFDGGSHLKLWIRPVVAWNRDHPASKINEVDLESRLYATLSHCRRRYRPDSPQVLDGLETVQEFIAELPAVIRKAERLFFSEVAREQPETAQPAELPRRPRFSGPGPGFGHGRGDADGEARQPGSDREGPGPHDFPNTEGTR